MIYHSDTIYRISLLNQSIPKPKPVKIVIIISSSNRRILNFMKKLKSRRRSFVLDAAYSGAWRGSRDFGSICGNVISARKKKFQCTARMRRT